MNMIVIMTLACACYSQTQVYTRTYTCTCMAGPGCSVQYGHVYYSTSHRDLRSPRPVTTAHDAFGTTRERCDHGNQRGILSYTHAYEARTNTNGTSCACVFTSNPDTDMSRYALGHDRSSTRARPSSGRPHIHANVHAYARGHGQGRAHTRNYQRKRGHQSATAPSQKKTCARVRACTCTRTYARVYVYVHIRASYTHTQPTSSRAAAQQAINTGAAGRERQGCLASLTARALRETRGLCRCGATQQHSDAQLPHERQ